MNLFQNPAMADLKTRLLESMREFMREADVEYGEADIVECGTILDEHLSAVAAAADRDDALACVRTTVLRLNALNERCDDSMIETDERETICEFIIRAGAIRGFNEEDEDVTEDWREW